MRWHLLTAVGALFMGGDVGAEDWPEFRGPRADGHSQAVGLPVAWGPSKNVVWKSELPGKAWSSPIVVGERIYLTNAVTTDGDSAALEGDVSLRVLALNASDGAVLWDKEVFKLEKPQALGMHQKNSYASATPVFADGKIFAHFGHFGTVCLDESGGLLWKSTELAYAPVHGNGGCPVLVDGLLIFLADAGKAPFMAALDAATGEVRWKKSRVTDARRTFSFSTPLVIEVGGQKQVVCPGSNGVSALNPLDGSEIWRVNYEGYSVVPRPVFGHGMIFMSTGYDRAKALAIRVDGKGDVTDSHVAWEMTGRGAPLTPSMLLIGDEVYMVADNGLVTCADAMSGKVHWQERVARQTSASPLYADGKIYVQDESGGGYVLEAGKKFKLLGTNDLDDRSLASPAVVGNRLLIRTQQALWCLGEK
ncbi:serine/threonine protein kinase [Phragmitibacter flavus]|uniref:Serine/threonine protein kinase n=1 Tax=Phragmitibacter flavus TaxID=2576071 RepID=A0A5R8K986_9BACT|nr:PQQ-like beta-propeller repeat protein [Phragmitibacter flavus]TLD68851.1 serine/threonine protein kinase [Phragmitibacter flavus]